MSNPRSEIIYDELLEFQVYPGTILVNVSFRTRINFTQVLKMRWILQLSLLMVVNLWSATIFGRTTWVVKGVVVSLAKLSFLTLLGHFPCRSVDQTQLAVRKRIEVLTTSG
ncbi:hypothetical protein [Amylolactobacillus amylophilus]|uniref:hypothetical protein n=1 Tax=Amylolactobacillus amylophilus TaxID=1603 RepID=UPI001141CE0F|nr:hypothetical protein [Amylolactobacillus amylophilus]